MSPEQRIKTLKRAIYIGPLLLAGITSWQAVEWYTVSEARKDYENWNDSLNDLYTQYKPLLNQEREIRSQLALHEDIELGVQELNYGELEASIITKSEEMQNQLINKLDSLHNSSEYTTYKEQFTYLQETQPENSNNSEFGYIIGTTGGLIATLFSLYIIRATTMMIKR